MRKKYLPVTYVDENGECWDKEKLKSYEYQRKQKDVTEHQSEWGDIYVYTTQHIENIRKKPTQGSLF